MAITKLNYVPGTYEAITDEALDDTAPVLNTWYYFKIDGWSHAISDVVLKQAGSPLPGSAYELTTDQKYTDREENESAKTLYAKWRIVDVTYDLIATTVSGNNFLTYVDNEAVNTKFNNLAAADVSYNNGVSGLSATDVQDAIDELATGSVYVPPSLGSENTAYSAALGSTTTVGFNIEDPESSTTKVFEAYAKFSVAITGAPTSGGILYLLSSTTGAESGSSAWAHIATMTIGAGGSTRYVKLQPGRYRMYIVYSGSGNIQVDVKYKWANTQVSYS